MMMMMGYVIALADKVAADNALGVVNYKRLEKIYLGESINFFGEPFAFVETPPSPWIDDDTCCDTHVKYVNFFLEMLFTVPSELFITFGVCSKLSEVHELVLYYLFFNQRDFSKIVRGERLLLMMHALGFDKMVAEPDIEIPVIPILKTITSSMLLTVRKELGNLVNISFDNIALRHEELPLVFSLKVYGFFKEYEVAQSMGVTPSYSFDEILDMHRSLPLNFKALTPHKREEACCNLITYFINCGVI